MVGHVRQRFLQGAEQHGIGFAVGGAGGDRVAAGVEAVIQSVQAGELGQVALGGLAQGGARSDRAQAGGLCEFAGICRCPQGA